MAVVHASPHATETCSGIAPIDIGIGIDINLDNYIIEIRKCHGLNKSTHTRSRYVFICNRHIFV